MENNQLLMDKEVKSFNFEKMEVEAIIINDDPYFVGNEVAKALGYSNYRNAVNNHVDDEDKHRTQIEYAGQKREVTLINESGLYSLIFDAAKQSKNTEMKEIAKSFKRWVTSEVLPALRQNGQYSTENMSRKEILQMALESEEQREKLQKQNEQLLLENNMQNQQIGELKPKAEYHDLILKNKGLVNISQIAKDYGMSAQKMNDILHDLKVQYKQAGQWLLYMQYHDKGYTHSVTEKYYKKDGNVGVNMHTKWTQKGRLFLYDLLKRNGIVPIIEQNDYELNLGGNKQ
ncbi:phage antirepressor [Staphylococcus pettenkoferi]|uniref:phage antirepressor n=1 Tax=Staphylococcus pettenkoferi TaxID=170573 RepID=UPI0022763C68|nr:phage antirepressor KilAC domain-containing protein [Staphylococcus pettenkoferi]MCY1563851.1 phage antirepressor KilAC domain-containing protein [Staphylococcus pettenkoferi]